ncbi:hypothetical protein [Pseudocitrobacter sp. 73]|uniref:hypothetical protein n=1 Tax=Pseudocitrobacter sp. 73 TaxID=2605731 RepID=UPI0011EC9975|nr:hypothetical protein [Pseudocitrobacter sp. 73]KAA1047226.1 hypothetical protein F0Q32_20110 [Pseudocitrobacter sp. 73]
MLKVENLSLSMIHGTSDDGVEACESFIFLNHVNTGIIVPVCWLELAVLLEDGRYLILATDENPFEQTLEILLVDLQEGVQERIGLFIIYHDGSLENVNVYDSCIEFSYFSTEVWRLSVSKNKRYRLPPRGLWAMGLNAFRFHRFMHVCLLRYK